MVHPMPFVCVLWWCSAWEICIILCKQRDKSTLDLFVYKTSSISHIGRRKYLNEYTPYWSVSLWVESCVKFQSICLRYVKKCHVWSIANSWFMYKNTWCMLSRRPSHLNNMRIYTQNPGCSAYTQHRVLCTWDELIKESNKHTWFRR